MAPDTVFTLSTRFWLLQPIKHRGLPVVRLFVLMVSGPEELCGDSSQLNGTRGNVKRRKDSKLGL